MKILIDMQGAQTPGSRRRGIGRYSLSFAEGILRNRGEHDVHLLLNGAFPDAIVEIKDRLAGLVDKEKFHIFHPNGPTCQSDPANRDRRIASELLREGLVAKIKPDILHVSSHFEGFGEEAVNSIGRLTTPALTSVTLFDLIPHIHRQVYLENPLVRAWYDERLAHLRRADLLLSISASSGREAVEYLGFPEWQVVNVSTAADSQFKKRKISASKASELLNAYAIRKRFVMYTGGIDYRKNIERLIEAYARLGKASRSERTLAIVCSCSDPDRERLSALGASLGLGAKDLIFTGYVSDDDLIDLYGLCELFVFPSWHEGFGLPALEAMWCGAPVIGSNCSSLPEVIGRDDALFDPKNVPDITATMERVLSKPKFRNELKAHSSVQARKFSWDATTKKAITAFEEAFERSRKVRHPAVQGPGKPRLAYVSPLPPARSGIADFGAEFLPELARHYEIEVVVQQGKDFTAEMDPALVSNYPVRSPEEALVLRDSYDRILYHFGNSDHHGHMTEMIRALPGVVVLHDFFLSGLFGYLQHGIGIPGVFNEALFQSHGFAALRMLDNNRGLQETIWKYPCNRPVIDRALGIIVHSQYAKQLSDQWYGPALSTDWRIVPLARATAGNMTSDEKTRQDLGFSDAEFIICSFGGIAQTKLTDRVLEGFFASNASRKPGVRLVLVGSMPAGEFGSKLEKLISENASGGRVTVTDWVSPEEYRQYLTVADIAIQLRSLSRGETSAAVLDCLNYGVPTIINANGSMAELSRDAVAMLDDDFKTEDLAAAIDGLYGDEAKRSALAKAGMAIARARHNVRSCADAYQQAIEHFYRSRSANPIVIAESVASNCSGLSAAEKRLAALAIEGLSPGRRTFIDVGPYESDLPDILPGEVAEAITRYEQEDGVIIPIRVAPDGITTQYRYALHCLGLDIDPFDEHEVALSSGDRLWAFGARRGTLSLAIELSIDVQYIP